MTPHSCAACANAKKTEAGILCPVLDINLSRDFSDIFYTKNYCKDYREREHDRKQGHRAPVCAGKH